MGRILRCDMCGKCSVEYSSGSTWKEVSIDGSDWFVCKECGSELYEYVENKQNARKEVKII